jgi:hypothetical protein
MGHHHSRLDWPQGWERTPPAERDSGTKFSASRGDTSEALATEMERMDVDRWRAKTDSGGGHTKQNGLPKYSANPSDPGFVLRWTKEGRDHVIACDAYNSLDANLRCVYLWVKDTRITGERPVRTGNDQFAAAQLPSGDVDAVTTRPPPHEVLGIQSDAPDGLVQAAYREKIKEAHPDQGGTNQESKLVQWARDQMLGDQQA